MTSEATGCIKLKTSTRSGGARSLKAIIAPHAGLEFSGRVQAGGYVNINPTQYSTVFILGPSHHTGTRSCSLVSATHYETPLGNIEINSAIVNELANKRWPAQLKNIPASSTIDTMATK